MQKDGVDCPGVTVTKEEKIQQSGDRSLLTVKNILEFADEVKLSEVEPILTPQIECNMLSAGRVWSTPTAPRWAVSCWRATPILPSTSAPAPTPPPALTLG